MANVFVGKHGASQAAHDLVHIDQDLRIGLWIKGNRLNVRVDLAPLFGPVRADFVGPADKAALEGFRPRSEEHTSELQSLMRISYAVFCLKKNTYKNYSTTQTNQPTQNNHNETRSTT